MRARGLLFTLAIPVAVELSNDTSLHIPNPPALMVLAIVFSAFDGGVAAGLASAIFSLTFIAYYFSIPGAPFHFTDENFRRVMLWAVVLPLMAYLVGLLNRRSALSAAAAKEALVQQAHAKERAEAVEARIASQTLFRALLDHTDDSIEIIDAATGRFLDVNEKACRAHGYSREEFLQLVVSDLDPLVGERPWEETRRESQLTGSMLIETNHRRKDGSVFPAEINLAYVTLERDYMLAIVRDITERKRAEEALRTSEAALSQAQKLAKLGYYRWSNEERKLAICNDEYRRILGSAADDQRGVRPYLHPDDRERIERTYETIEREGTAVRLEFRIIRPDGKIRHVRDLSEPEPNPGGRAEYWFGTLQDITAQKEAQEELRRGEERFRTLTETMSDWHWETDDQFRVAVFSKTYNAEPLGGRQAVMGKTLWEIAGVTHPAPDSRWARLRELMRNHDPVRDFTYTLPAQNGHVMHRRASARPMFDPDGQFKGYLFAARDTTAEVEADARAHSAEEMLTRALASISDGIAIYDSDDRLTYHNEQYNSISLDKGTESHGKTFEELVRLDLSRGLHPDAVGREKEFVKERLAAHRRSGFAILFRTTEGLWIQARDHHMPDGSIVAVRTDVTSLVEAEQRFHSLADNLPGIVYRRIVQPDGDIQETYVSAGARRILGVEPEGFASGQTRLLDFLHPEDRERKIALLMEATRTLRPIVVETERYITSAGESRWWQVYAAPRRLADGATQFDGIAIDVTERRAAEEKLKRIQRLDALGQLTSGIAHDFNNLLMIIIGNLELFEEDAAKMGGRAGTLHSAALDAALRGSELVQRLLAVARQQPLKATLVNVNALIEGLQPLLRLTLGEPINIETDLPPEAWSVVTDPGQLEGALLNLAINARDAMAEGGTLTISTQNVRLGPDAGATFSDLQPGDYLKITVGDTGTGMPPDVLERALEPFFTTKGPGKGNGLGLAMVHGFVSQCGGQMHIRSQVGQGTTLELFLPRVQGALGEQDQVDAPTAALGGSETVLIVEDDPAVRDTAAKMLRSLGYNVLEAKNPQEAKSIAHSGTALGVVFTDLVMPGGESGWHLAQDLWRTAPELPVLFTSGYSDNPLIQNAAFDTQIAVLSKPYNKRQLAEEVRRVLGRRSQSS